MKWFSAKIILMEILDNLANSGAKKIIIFCSSGEVVEEINEVLLKNEFQSAVLYSS